MKKKIYLKLTAMTLLTLVSIVTVVSASYAWFTMSTSPVVNGIQVSLSGGTTILIAPDQTAAADGVVYHYPGAFSDTLDFSQHSSYDYLHSLGGLSPVSTADGIHWYLATYYDADDERVKGGLVSRGELRPVQEFLLDASLGFANQQAETESIAMGHYVYLDFWVVSPVADYTLRISTGEDGGSFVIDLLDPVESSESFTGYTLQNKGLTSTSTSVRVGFLTSENNVTDLSMLYYQASAGYDPDYTVLRGMYPEAGSTVSDPQAYQFYIYEPNANAHPSGNAEEGSFVATYPLAMFNGIPTPTSVLDRTAVQLTNWWTAAPNGTDLMLEQVFQTSMYGKPDAEAAAAAFYTDYLQRQFSDLIDRGSFISSSASLADAVSAQRLQTLEKASVTEDVYIVELEQNVPQRIRMFVWLEGQDVDWDPYFAGNSFAVNIEFAGGDQ